jgi:uncharacterized protein
MSRQTRILITLLSLVGGLWVASRVPALYADYLWFDSLGYAGAFTTTLYAKVAMSAAVLAITLTWFLVNILIAGRLSPGRYLKIKGLPWVIPSQQMKRALRALAVIGIAVVSFSFAATASQYWYSALQTLNRVSFQWTDPVFHYDAGFYVFVLPSLAAIKGYAMALLVLGLGLTAATYFIGGAIAWPGEPITRGAALHLSILAALLALVFGYGYWLDQFDLLLGSRGAVFGAGYTDVNVRLPALRVMMAVCAVAALLLVLAGVRRKAKLAYGAVLLVALVHFFGLWSYPTFVQRFEVEPNELTLESQYIKNNIQATRHAYDLSNVEVRPYSGAGNLTLKEVREVPGTIDNVRIWDWQVLKAVYNQIQSLRPYYHFEDVDVDRYAGRDQYRQVTLAVRELEPALLNADSRTWVNLHLLYTHGYGLVMNPVNEVTREGLPELWLRDIPPQNPPESQIRTPITQPGIYFGELTRDEVYVSTRPVEGHAPEFDYPLGEENRYTSYDGKGGVAVDSFSRRLLFAYYFGDWNVLLTDSFSPETRVLWRRQIVDRARHLAPFLKFDGDPYPVVHEGRIVWVIDAYTETDRFPYASRTTVRGHAGANYVRNPVKTVVDAYDGTVTFYVIDPQDPLIVAARSIFPGLFHDYSEMPEDLRRHVRYPNDYFEIQAEQYLAYHMTDPQIFYNKEDLWQRPKHLAADKLADIPAYYFIMTLPGQKTPEYILMLPFTPATNPSNPSAKKENMVGWMAGRCDGKDYGKLLVYTFPKDHLVFGPNQIEARINQNDRISPLLTLWNQHGSRVVRGNLLVIPVADSVLYVEPLYLKSEEAAIPELKRVIVSYQDRIVMENTLDEALATVFGQAPPSAAPPALPLPPSPTPAPTPAATPGQRALQLFEKAQREQREGRWAEYGATQEELRKVLQEIAKEPPPK